MTHPINEPGPDSGAQMTDEFLSWASGLMLGNGTMRAAAWLAWQHQADAITRLRVRVAELEGQFEHFGELVSEHKIELEKRISELERENERLKAALRDVCNAETMDALVANRINARALLKEPSNG